jgi:AraC-like DNA-binding protein
MSRVGKSIIKDLKGLNTATTELNTTVAQWREALSAATAPKFPNAKTLTELSRELEINRSTLRDRLRDAMLAGTCRAFRDIRNKRETTVYELAEKKA